MNLFLRLCVPAIVLGCQTAAAQQSAGEDLGDVMHGVFKSKSRTDSIVSHKKVFGSFFPGAGYSLQTGMAVVAGANFGFYTNSSHQQKLSSITTSGTYSQYHQFIFPVAASIYSPNDQYNYLIDYRFLRYPSVTYGLGPRTTPDRGYSIFYNNIKLHQTVLKKISDSWYAGIGLYFDKYWNISELDPPTGTKTSFQRYGLSQTETAVGPAFRIVQDSRDNQINPQKGTYISLVYRPNFTFLGSDNNWQSLQADFRTYIPLSRDKKSKLAIWTYGWFSMGKPPYLLLPSNGWDDQYNTGRGYIQSRFRAKDMLYAEAEYRFPLLKNGLLGGVAFMNASSFSKDFSGQLNVIAPGMGAGLRIKLNKHSGANLCIDYGFGMDGSKGVFINLGEVF